MSFLCARLHAAARCMHDQSQFCSRRRLCRIKAIYSVFSPTSLVHSVSDQFISPECGTRTSGSTNIGVLYPKYRTLISG